MPLLHAPPMQRRVTFCDREALLSLKIRLGTLASVPELGENHRNECPLSRSDFQAEGWQ